MKINAVTGKIDSNTFVVEHENTVLIIDAGAPLARVKHVLDGRSPSAILLTHEHYDHVFYLNEYVGAFNCPVINAPDNPVRTEDEIIAGNVNIKPMLCPGHSPHSVVYKIDNVLFTGDVLFNDTIGRTDLMPNGEIIMQGTLKRLLGVQFETAYHGHYEESSYAEQQKNIRRFII